MFDYKQQTTTFELCNTDMIIIYFAVLINYIHNDHLQKYFKHNIYQSIYDYICK